MNEVQNKSNFFRVYLLFYVGHFSVCTSDVQLNNLTSDPMVCHLDFTCLGVDCCIQVDMARRTLRASLNLDPCSQIMTIALERFTINVDLTNYTFGRSTAPQRSTVWGKLV